MAKYVIPPFHLDTVVERIFRKFNQFTSTTTTVTKKVYSINITVAFEPYMVQNVSDFLINVIYLTGLEPLVARSLGRADSKDISIKPTNMPLWELRVRKFVIRQAALVAHFCEFNPNDWIKFNQIYNRVKFLEGPRQFLNLIYSNRMAFDIGSFGFLRVELRARDYANLEVKWPFLVSERTKTIPFLDYDDQNVAQTLSQLFEKHTKYRLEFSEWSEAPGTNPIKCIGDSFIEFDENFNPKCIWVLQTEGYTSLSAAYNLMFGTQVIFGSSVKPSNKVNYLIRDDFPTGEAPIPESYKSDFYIEVDDFKTERHNNIICFLFTGIDAILPETGLNWKGNPNSGPGNNPGSPSGGPRGSGSGPESPNNGSNNPTIHNSPDGSIIIEQFDSNLPSAPPMPSSMVRQMVNNSLPGNSKVYSHRNEITPHRLTIEEINESNEESIDTYITTLVSEEAKEQGLLNRTLTTTSKVVDGLNRVYKVAKDTANTPLIRDVYNLYTNAKLASNLLNSMDKSNQTTINSLLAITNTGRAGGSNNLLLGSGKKK